MFEHEAGIFGVKTTIKLTQNIEYIKYSYMCPCCECMYMNVHVSKKFAFRKILLIFTYKYIYIFMTKVFPTRTVVLRKKQITVLTTDKV